MAFCFFTGKGYCAEREKEKVRKERETERARARGEKESKHVQEKRTPQHNRQTALWEAIPESKSANLKKGTVSTPQTPTPSVTLY